MSEPTQAQRARDLTPEQLSELVMRRKKKREAQVAASGSEGIVRRGVSTAPLSFAQQRLWLLDQLEPDNAAYNLGTAVRLLGELDPWILAKTLTEISRRHESLRTTFAVRDGDPIQVVAPHAPFPLPITDLSALPAAIRDREVHRLARLDAATPFQLSEGPLARAQLLIMAPQEHLLLFNMHHIISDGWSFGLLFGEISTLFEAFSAGQPSPLPELPVQYTDFSLWQREWLQGATLQEQVSYWRDRLQGAAPSLELPTDRVRPPLPSHRGEVALLELSETFSTSLREFSRRNGSTLFMTMLAAFKILLHRWAGQEDIVIGSPSAGRRLVETEGMIGFFLNTLVLRSDLGGNPTYLELLDRVRDGVLGAYRYQDVPFERLLEELQVERQLSRPPLFQVLFNMITLPDVKLTLRGLRLEPLGDTEALAKFDFTFYMRDSAGQIRGHLVYNADLFDRPRMEAMVAEYEYLLEQIVAAPETPIEALSLVPRGLAAVLPDPAQPLPTVEWPGPIHERLTLHAARHPDREMVADAAEAWSYGELEARSNQLAHRLRDAGVGREDVVAIYAHRSASVVWAAIATLKSGAAFLFLDPAYPPARLVEYLEIARPVAWLSVRGPGEAAPVPPAVEEALRGLPLRARFELPPLSEAAAAGLFAEQPVTPPEHESGPDDLACIGFTSGSTGKPKAVLGRHAPLSQYQPWWQERFDLGEGDRFAMLSALSHDPLQRDILTPIWLGASLRIPDPERVGEPGWLNAWAAAQQITVVHLTPAMLEILVGGETEPRLLSLRRAFVVGDLLRRSEVTRLQRVAPAVDCVNLYGSTESQRSVSYSPVSRPGEGPAGKEALPLGRGIPGVELLVLNAAGSLAGIGEVGEVYLRSRSLARGYLGDAELTAERFRTNPFRIGRFGESDSTDRVYRTGDLGRYRPDGEVDFAGRADAQVKIRGFRIEPGEIEAALRRHPAVRECVVVTRGEGEKRLVAYLAPASAAVGSRELRAFLADGLPDYMVPSAFVWLDSLPMTKTGKLDRRALPEAQAEVSEETEPSAASPIEELLTGIWLELLGGERTIGLHDNFFDLGGHSLLATRVLSRIREALGVVVPLRALFEAPTISGLAEAVARKQEEARPAAPPLVPQPRDAGLRLPLSFTQQRLWILDQVEPGSFAYNLPGALRLHGEVSIEALRMAISEIVRRHESLRTLFPSDEADAWQRVLPAEDRPLPMVDLGALPEAERTAEAGHLATANALQAFDLARGPLFTALLIRLEATEHALLLSMHHMVTDGWSIAIFSRELTELYRAYAAGRPSPLAALPIQYADFAVWQRAWLQGEVLDEQLRYWSGSLKGAPPVLELPTDFPRPAVRSHRGGRQYLNLSQELTERLAQEGRHLDVTPFMSLLAAFAVLLRRYSGEEDLVIGTPIANRSRRELEDLIGFFANTLALRVDSTGDPSFGELARRVRNSALGAYAHQDLPFERLVDELQPQRNLNHAPIFQVMFVFQNAPRERLQLGDLTFSSIEVEEGKAQFDLTLSLMQHEGGVVGRLEYSQDLFEAATAERLMRHFESLVTGAVASPSARISMLPLLDETERRELLVTHNDTGVEYPAELTVHELFEASVERFPEAVAVACGERHLTYRELDERATRLAHRLVEVGVGPEVRVALCMARTPEMVVAMLAVMKAGGAYLPLDPSHPADRLGWIIEDAGAGILVADAASLEALPETGGTVIDPSALDPHAAWPPAPLPSTSGPENLAYVIYTSGSTGRPKGVEVRHGGVVNYLLSMARRPGLGHGDTVLALTTLSFDIAVTELLLPLAVGARIELIDRETAGDAERLAAVMEAAGVTVMQATPATWMLLLEGGWKGRPGLKVLAGGEALPLSLAERLLGVVGELWNVYGPTETTVWSTLHRVLPGDGRISIGRPLANTRIHLLDQGGDLAPLGVAGELCIGGEGLARGYLGRPDLTAERFVPDPFGSGGRLYRTGDLARRVGNGDLEFLGRIDNQVKVHGFRIELGEIEAALSRLPGVAQGVVVVRERGAGDRFLVGYVVAADPAAPPSTADLRAGLKERLPEYMVPNTFVTLEALPLNTSGKVDRRSLTQMPLTAGAGIGAEEREITAPRNELEATIARIWSDILGLPEIDIHGNFFELGGDSIQGIRVVAAAKRAGVYFTPRHLFQHQTVAALALIATVETEAVPGALVATPFQRRLLAGDPAVLPLWNEAVLLEPAAGLGAAELGTALAELARRHEALRLRFAWQAEGWTLETAEPEERATLERIDLGSLPGDAELLARAEEVRDRIDLSVCPWKAAIFHRGGGAPDLVLLAVHRLALDGASWEVLLDDLRSIAAPLRPLEGSAASRLTSLRSDLRSAALSTELDVEESQELLGQVAQRYGATAEEILAGALVCAASGWSGARRVVLEVERRHGADRAAGDRRVGCFSSLVTLNAEAVKDPVLALKRTRDELRSTPEADERTSRSHPEIALRWLGRWEAEADGWRMQPLASRYFHGGRTFELAARLERGRLRLDWDYVEGFNRPEAARALAEATATALRSLLEVRTTRQSEVFTVSDFPAAGLSEEGLNDLLAELALD